MAAYRRVFMTHVACRLTAKNRDQLRNPTLGNRVWATFTFSPCFHGFEAATGVAGSIPLAPGATTLGKLFARFCPVIRQNNLVPVNGHGRSATGKVTVSSGIAPAARYRLQWSNYAGFKHSAHMKCGTLRLLLTSAVLSPWAEKFSGRSTAANRLWLAYLVSKRN